MELVTAPIAMTAGIYVKYAGLFDLAYQPQAGPTPLLDMPVISETTTTLCTSYNPDTSLGFEIRDKQLYVTDLPDTSGYAYIYPAIVDSSGVTRVSKDLPRQSMLSEPISLAELGAGTYYLTLGIGSEEYGYYSYIIDGQDIEIRVSDSNACFVMPLVYADNVQLFYENYFHPSTMPLWTQPTLDARSDDPTIIEKSAEIVEGLTSDYDKAYAIHRWVADNIGYQDMYLINGSRDDVQRTFPTAVNTLRMRKGVCQGYAALDAALLRAAGIPARFVTGYALGTGTSKKWEVGGNGASNHAWIGAWVEDRWIICDPTWDSTRGTRDYLFDVTLEAFSSSHEGRFYGLMSDSLIDK